MHVELFPLFLALLLGHYAGDYLLQTHRQAVGKLDPGLSGLRHAATHAGALTAAQAGWLALLAPIAPVSLPSAAIALGINAGSHLAIDWARRGPRWWCHRTGSVAFYDNSQPTAERMAHTHGAERVDQALHYQFMGFASWAGALA